MLTFCFFRFSQQYTISSECVPYKNKHSPLCSVQSLSYSLYISCIMENPHPQNTFVILPCASYKMNLYLYFKLKYLCSVSDLYENNLQYICAFVRAFDYLLSMEILHSCDRQAVGRISLPMNTASKKKCSWKQMRCRS